MIILIILLIFCLVAMGIALLMINFLKETNSRTEEKFPRGRNLPSSCRRLDRRSVESFCWISTDPSSTSRSIPRLQYQQQEEFFSFNTFKPDLSLTKGPKLNDCNEREQDDITGLSISSKQPTIYPVPNINSLRRSDLTVYYV